MSFDPEGNRVPTSVPFVELRLRVTENGGPNTYAGVYEFPVLDQHGRAMAHRSGDYAAYVMANAPTNVKAAQVLVLDWALQQAQAVIP